MNAECLLFAENDGYEKEKKEEKRKYAAAIPYKYKLF